MTKVLVLGAGKMVEAILVGLHTKMDLSNWSVYSPSGITAKILADKVGAKHATDLENQNPDWVIVGCKPQQLKTLGASKYPNALHLSLLAAIEEKTQREILGVSQLIRVMPNLSVKFGEGVTLLSSDSAKPLLKTVEDVFSKLGLARTMAEKELEELTLLTGSGPALFYEFTKILASQFKSMTESDRELLARQVLTGAGMSVKNETLSLGPMIDAVTSKGGVTIAALEEWRKSSLAKGIQAGLRRTQELKKLLMS